MPSRYKRHLEQDVPVHERTANRQKLHMSAAGASAAGASTASAFPVVEDCDVADSSQYDEVTEGDISTGDLGVHTGEVNKFSLFCCCN